jgi:hypothetical protein
MRFELKGRICLQNGGVDMTSVSPRIIRLAAVFYALFIVDPNLVVAAPSDRQEASAKQFKEWRLPKPTSSQSQSYRTMLRTGEVTDPDSFENVCNWQVCQLTWFELLGTAPKIGEKLVRDLRLAGRAPNNAAHRRLNDVLLRVLPQIASDDSYHQGTRCNAMLLLGRLNQREPNLTTKDMGEPQRKVLPILIASIDEPFREGPKTNDVVRVAALNGLRRYALYPFANESLRQRLLQSVIAIAGTTTPPPGRTSEGNDWLRRRALDILALASQGSKTKVDAEADATMRKVFLDRQSSLKVRLSAASAWSHADNASSIADPEADELLAALAALSLKVIDSEVVPGTKGQWTLRRAESRRVLASQLFPLHSVSKQLATRPRANLAKVGPPPVRKSAACADALSDCLKAISNGDLSDKSVAKTIHELSSTSITPGIIDWQTAQ